MKPQLVLLGTGDRQQFPPVQIRGAFVRAGVGLEVMDLGAACRTFNVLVQEERRVCAALLFGVLKKGRLDWRSRCSKTSDRQRAQEEKAFQPTNYSKLTDSNNCVFFLVLTDNYSCSSLDSPPSCALCGSLPAVAHVGDCRHVNHVTLKRAST